MAESNANKTANSARSQEFVVATEFWIDSMRTARRSTLWFNPMMPSSTSFNSFMRVPDTFLPTTDVNASYASSRSA